MSIETIEFYDADSEGLEIEEIKDRIDNFPEVVERVRNKIHQKKLIVTLETNGVKTANIGDIKVPCSSEDMLGIIIAINNEKMFAFAAKTPGFKRLRLFSEEGTQLGRILMNMSLIKLVKNQSS
jgi:hypothetical protein